MGTIKSGSRITGMIVSTDSPGLFQAAFEGLLHKPIYVTAVPVVFALYQAESEVVYEKPD